MSFHTESITGTHLKYQLAHESQYGGNRINLLVGPNGSGKTQLLVDLLEHYLPRRGNRSKQAPLFQIKGTGAPSRVIAQTFTPFSRFPQEYRKPPGLSEYLKPNVGSYAAIGVARHGIGRPVSRTAVSRILRRLYSAPEDAGFFATTLKNIGFLPTLTMAYTRSPLGHSVDFGASGSELHRSLEGYLATIRGRARPLAQELPLSRELAEEDTAKDLVGMLEQAIDTITQLESPELAEAGAADFAFEIDLAKAIDEKLSRCLHAFLVLTRTGFLHIRNCFVTYAPSDRRPRLPAGRRDTLDITDASSGQQQLLSSLFGIAAEVEDNALLLIDEPELSLHPEWQSTYLDNLFATLHSRRNCEVFVATHSPLITQRARELNVGMLDLGGPRLDKPGTGTVSIDQILLENFHIPVRDSTYVGQLLLALVMQAERGEVETPVLTARLEALQALYAQSAVQDQKMNRLISQASKLVQSAVDRSDSSRV